MADSFVPVTFVADELLTSTKMNLLAANQAGFHDGTALGDGIIVTRHLANAAGLQTRSYSTAEQLTREKWIDGKPIYSRTFSGTISQASGTRSEIQLLNNVSTIISSEGWWAESPSGFRVPSGHPWLAANGSVYGGSSLRLSSAGVVDFLSWVGGVRASAPYEVTINYTKQ